jgi:pyruvate formate lyase activating enzyme
MLQNDKGKSGIIFEIERYAIHDGPGIRTLVFFKGCPLRCKWCSNPESHHAEPELVYWKNKCISCGMCIKSCDYGALSSGTDGIIIDKNKCCLCGKCTEVCNTEALKIIGKEMTAYEVVEEVLKDEAFYSDSGGGVTFSGGEAFAQHEFLLELAKLCKQNQIHTCIETSGFVRWEHMEEVSPYIDLFLYDFKLMDSNKHKEYTGVPNELILENFKKLVKNRKSIVARVPVIPGINDYKENFEQMILFLSKYAPGIKVDLLPYHRLGIEKYNRLNKEYELKEILPPANSRMLEIKEMFTSNGFEVGIGG